MKKKIICIILILAAAFCIGTGTAAVLETNNDVVVKTNELNWGLGFGNEGSTPTGNSSASELKEYNAFYVGDESKKIIYITFDAGYENGNMDKILEALKKHGVSATFFIVGNFIETNPELVKKMVDEGHIIGNHSYHHSDMSNMTKEKFVKEINDLETAYESVTGKKMEKVYRPPQGKYSMASLSMAKELGYKTIFWSLAYVDWYDDKQPTKEEAFDKLLKRIHPGAIVLLHSTSKTNGEILDELLTKWEEMGYSFGKLSEIQ